MCMYVKVRACWHLFPSICILVQACVLSPRHRTAGEAEKVQNTYRGRTGRGEGGEGGGIF